MIVGLYSASLFLLKPSVLSIDGFGLGELGELDKVKRSQLPGLSQLQGSSLKNKAIYSSDHYCPPIESHYMGWPICPRSPTMQ